MMKAYQVKHALRRLDEEYSVKRAALKLSCYDKNASKPLTAGELYDDLRKGKVTLAVERDRQIGSWTYIHNVFDLSKYSDRINGHEPNGKFDNKKYNDGEAKLNAEYGRVKDELILGDAKEALKLIEAFAKFKV